MNFVEELTWRGMIADMMPGTEEQLQRILRRNGPEKLQMFRERWIPMENKYFEAFEIEKKSMVIDCTGFSR